jgi:hypothetical protein
MCPSELQKDKFYRQLVEAFAKKTKPEYDIIMAERANKHWKEKV